MTKASIVLDKLKENNNQKTVDSLEARAAELSKKIKAAEAAGDSVEADKLKAQVKRLNDQMSALKGDNK